MKIDRKKELILHKYYGGFLDFQRHKINKEWILSRGRGLQHIVLI